ncbi:MAG: DUF6057 family protein [Bacteroidales bacterium]|nr:DUF6057 family protein [Bacteroidales bacterium]
MNKLTKYIISSFLWLLAFVAIFLYFELKNKYLFSFIEQNQLFLFDWDYVLEKISKPAGVSVILKEFILQFFNLNHFGALACSLLLIIVGISTQTIVKKINPKSMDVLLWALPMITQLPLIINFDYQINGLLSYIVMQLLFIIYIYYFYKNVYKLIFLSVSSIIFFWLFGAASFYFVISVFIYELFNNIKQSIYFSLPIILVFILARLSVYDYYLISNLSLALTPEEYYNRLLKPGIEIYFSWLSFPIIIILSSIFSKHYTNSLIKRLLNQAFQICLILCISFYMFKKEEYYTKDDTRKFLKYDYYLRYKQWDNIISESKNGVSNYLLNYAQNIALIEKDIFPEKAFFYTQKGIESITIDWSDNNPFIFPLISDMYFAVGNVSIAQEVAFKKMSESIAVNNSLNPRMLKRLIETNIIYGGNTGYSVANKYINILKTTLYYKKWAQEKEIYLFNDEAVNKDSIFGALRLNLKNIDILYSINNNSIQLKEMSCSAFSKKSLDYYCMGYLLNTDLDGFYKIVSTCYGEDILKRLPQSYQEALLIYGAQNKTDLSRYNISEQTRKRFLMFQDFAAKNFNRKDLAAIMKKSYNNTYWYYFMFIKN